LERPNISFYQYARLAIVNFSKSFVYPLERLDVLGRIMWLMKVSQRPPCLRSCRNFQSLFKKHIWTSITFWKNVRLNVAIEQETKSIF